MIKKGVEYIKLYKKPSFFAVPKQLKIMLYLILSIFVLGVIGHMIIYQVGFVDAVLMTFNSLAYLQSPTPEDGIAARLLYIFLVVLGIIVIWFVLWTFFDLIVAGEFTEYYSRVSIMKKMKKTRNHYIICGGGRVGTHIAEMLKRKHKKYIVIEKDETTVAALSKKNINAIDADVLEETTLLDAGLANAKAVIAVLPETEKNIMITLTAKEHRSDITVYARADKSEFIKKLKKAGADYIVMPELVCAEEIIEDVEKHENGKKPAALFKKDDLLKGGFIK